MHVRTVLQQGNTHARRELRGQRLDAQRRTGNLLAWLTNQQAQCILRGPYLALELVGLRQRGQIGSLGTLDTGRTHATQLVLELHHLPRLLGHLTHLCHDGHLLVKHQQGIVAVGNATDDLGTDSHLVVLIAQEFHLCRTLLRQDVTKEVEGPAGCRRYGVRPDGGRRIGMHRRDATHG